MTTNSIKPALPPGIYGITDETSSRGRTNVQVVRGMIAGGIKIIQYRAKGSGFNDRRRLEECRAIRELTREAGVLFIINDHPDIALLVDADGVHVGQDDLPVAAVRKLIGDSRLIGLSTHSPEQARDALRQGADYIGAGPIYATPTKADVCDAVGLAYLDFVSRQVDLPFVAIGGIKMDNIGEVAARGAKCICLVSEIVGATDIPSTVRQLNELLEANLVNTTDPVIS